MTTRGTRDPVRPASDDAAAAGAVRPDAHVRVGGESHRPLLSLADAARAIVGTHQAVGTRLYGGTWDRATTYVTLSDKYAEYRGYDVVPKGLGVLNAVTRDNTPLRLTAAELLAHPEYRGLRDAPGHPRESRSKQAIAAALERPLQPPPLPAIEGVELAATYQPYGGHGDLGGDFYDVFELPAGRWLVALGDVSGKGPEAAAVTGLVRYTLWAAAQYTNDPVAILRVVNAALLRQDTDRFATVVAAVLTPGARGVAVEAAWAGHLSAILLRADGGEQVRGRGMPLGMFDAIDLQAVRLHVLPGETLLLYTDGLVERRGAVLDEDALVRIVTDAAGLPVGGLIDRVVGAVDERYARRDDLAVLAIRAS